MWQTCQYFVDNLGDRDLNRRLPLWVRGVESQHLGAPLHGRPDDQVAAVGQGQDGPTRVFLLRTPLSIAAAAAAAEAGRVLLLLHHHPKAYLRPTRLISHPFIF